MTSLSSNSMEKYRKSMEHLSAPAGPDHPGKTNVDLYVEWQRAYDEAVARKEEAHLDELRRLKEDRADIEVMMEEWMRTEGERWEKEVQEVYMKWVVLGKKADVEYW
jgi:hypothetical protein